MFPLEYKIQIQMVFFFLLWHWFKSKVSREWDGGADRASEGGGVTDGGRAPRVNLAVTAFSLLMSDVFFLYPPPDPPTLRILWDFKASISSRAEWFGPGYCVNLEYSSGNFFALRAQTLLGSFGDSHDTLPPHLRVVNVAGGGVWIELMPSLL